MSDFSFLLKYILPSEKEASTPLFSGYKHQLFPLSIVLINKVENIMQIPFELKEFYNKIGYGFFYNQKKTAFNRLMDIGSFEMINLREDFYEFDPQLEIYDILYQREKLLFFEIIEGNYLAIDINETNGKNAIYHFEKKIADSLEDFLVLFDNNPELLSTSLT